MKKASWRNIKIGGKYGAAFFITILLFMVAAGFIINSLFDIRESMNNMELKSEISLAVNQMNALFKTKELIITDHINFQKKSTLDEYTKVKEEYEELQLKIQPYMEDMDLGLEFHVISNNNTQVDQIFVDQILPYNKEDNAEGMIIGFINISSFRNSTTQLFGNIITKIDEERQQSVISANNEIERSISVMLTGIVSAALLGIILVLLISRIISRNLNRVVKVTDEIANGDLTAEAIQYYGRDEIGRLSLSINAMLNNLQNIIREIAEAAVKVDEESNLLKVTTEEVKQSSELITSTMSEMSAGAQEQAGSATEIANSIFNLTGLIEKANQNKEVLEVSSKGILEVIQKERENMRTSIENMDHINQIIKDSVAQVQILDENSNKISTLVQVINDIADQTNLLALNAAIEAARAGDAGRGFAVVADEIRKLAAQVGESVKEITDIVTGVQQESKNVAGALATGRDSVEAGSNQIKITGEGFEKIHNDIISMIEGINDVSGSLNEISVNSSKISEAGEQVAAISEENSAGIEHTVSSILQQNESMNTIVENSQSLSKSANKLKEIVNRFKQ